MCEQIFALLNKLIFIPELEVDYEVLLENNTLFEKHQRKYMSVNGNSTAKLWIARWLMDLLEI